MTTSPQAIMDGLVQYPLPAATGVRDYVFHFVPASDPYGAGAHAFLGRFYKNHSSHDVTSLEQMIGVLAADVASSVKQIRELVMVAHGTPQGLILPVLTAANATTTPEYRYLTLLSLAYLQRDMADGQYKTLHDQRAAVVACLTASSWVTIRACRIGLSEPNRYAYFSFFGGRANVYAPDLYQLFGTSPVGKAGRVANHLALHEHLCKQHYFPNDEHTPDRAEALVQAMIDPGKFAAPVQLATVSMSAAPATVQIFDKLVVDFNAGKVSAAMQAAFAAVEDGLTPAAIVKVQVKDEHWQVIDTVPHPQGPFRLLFDVEQTVTTTDATLTSTGHVVARSTGETFPLQLFLDDTEHADYLGQLFRMAAYGTGQGADAANKTTFDALVLLLTGNKYSDGTNDLQALFKEHIGVDLPPTPNIVKTSSTGSGTTAITRWTMGANPSYVVKQSVAVADDGTLGNMLVVYMDDTSRTLHEAEVVAHGGLDPDTPGVELAAYLDGFSLDELVALVDFLRSPYQPAKVQILRHAIAAMVRNSGYMNWLHAWIAAQGASAGPLAGLEYLDLKQGEAADFVKIAYDFDFNKVWSEVRQSFPNLYAFKTDLYAEEDLWTRFNASEPLPDRDSQQDLLVDSPGHSLDALQALERQGLDKLFAVDKAAYVPPSDPNVLSCDDFKTILAQWKALQGLAPADMKAKLDTMLAPDGRPLSLVLWEIFAAFDKINAPLDFLEIVELGHSIPSYVLSFFENLGHDAEAAEELEVVGVSSAFVEGVLPTLAGLIMWLEIVVDQQEAVEWWEGKGKLLAATEWLQQLASLARQGPVPDEPTVDIGEDALGDYTTLSGPGTFVLYAEDLQNGFDEGKEQMERVGPEIVRKADEAAAKILAKVDLDACKLQALKDAGVIDPASIRSAAVQGLVKALLARLPDFVTGK
jgi:hypothetical protein